jgi:hypothetical protein
MQTVMFFAIMVTCTRSAFNCRCLALGVVALMHWSSSLSSFANCSHYLIVCCKDFAVMPQCWVALVKLLLACSFVLLAVGEDQLTIR